MKFRKDYTMTTGVDLITKTVVLPDSAAEVHVFMVDCSGNEVWHDLLEPHILNSDAYLFVYDVGNPNSLRSLAKWFESVSNNKSDSEAVMGVVVANKCDTPDEHTQTNIEMGQKFSKDLGLEFFMTSAANGDVSGPLDFLAELFYNSYEERRHAIVKMI
eukprot:GHVR01167041.1.p1 GENE.GHVR01167041.1~~GHVR01167041.1.p1  ORF type:complete len:159 (+),score=32.67 GHVR01167041.1:218-694(+)